ncbi:MAG: BMP family ABC transporter substrate-binding protein [Chloroflexota bacterium]|nr:BMP family ABC transporter substrate-binding protein [Chloroflexota bacterium]
MKKRLVIILFALLLVPILVLTACQQTPEVEDPTEEQPPASEETEPEEFIFGILMVGPYNDRGYSQAHYEAGLYVEENIPGTKMIYLDVVNTADRPGTTAEQLADELVEQGAQLIIFNSDDMKDDAVAFTQNNPDIYVIHASGDSVWEEGKNYIELDNMRNVMGKMEYGKMIAGCDAALHTETGSIGYLGPLINEETRRLVASAHLGAKYCWENYLGNDPADLSFRVTWIGFWFNIPGVTEDPTQVANEFIDSGVDVIISGIDTTEALVEARKATSEGKQVYGIPYDFIGACEEAPDVCLGVPYFNWGPAYARYIGNAKEGNWESTFEWLPPDWDDINNLDTSAVGYVNGPGMDPENEATLDQFIDELAGGLNLWTGPLNFQDGTEFLAEGETATDVQVWYLPQLLEGIEGRSE